MNLSKFICIIIFLISAAGCGAPLRAEADILLKAVGKNEISLRPKTMDSRIAIHGQIAQIQTTLTMASELDIQSEADFEYTVPDNTLVTYFAYWYKGKKVVARIVTKERAAEIYRIVSHHKVREHHHWTYSDPAIVEMTDKNTFHVRIFPIEANADLKVEIHSVQLLDADAKGSLFTFPLKAPEKNKGTLEKIHLHLQLYPDSDVTGISNNYNLPLIRSNNIQTLDLQQQNWRAPQDLKVRFSRPVKALNASLYSARAGGADGFFALTLIPSQDIPKPRLEIQGVKTSQLLPAKLAPMKAHVPVLVTGRYSGAGAAKVLLHGYGKNGILTGTAKVLFSSQTAQPNAAAQFWAKLQMQHLATNPKNKSAVMQLSKRFNLPSEYTSWLALPEEGRKIYEKNLAERELDRYAPALAGLISAGKGKTAEARAYRKIVEQKAAIAGVNPDDAVAQYLAWQIERAADVIVAEKEKEHTNAKLVQHEQQYLNMLLSYIPTHTNRYIKYKVHEVTSTEYENAVDHYVSMVQEGKIDSPSAKELRAHIERFYAQQSPPEQQKLGAPEDSIKSEAYWRLQNLATSWAKEKLAPSPDEARMAELYQEMELLASTSGQNVNEATTGKVKYTALDWIKGIAQRATYEEIPDYFALTQQLINQTSTLGKRAGLSPQQQASALKEAEHILTQALSKKYFSIKDDPAHRQRANNIKNQLEQIASLTDVTYENLIHDAAHEWAKNQLESYGTPYKIILEESKKDPDYNKIMSMKMRMYEAAKILSPSDSVRQLSQTVEEKVEDRKAGFIAEDVGRMNRELAMEETLDHPDAEHIKELKAEREKEINDFSPKIREKLMKFIGGYRASSLYTTRDLLFREYRKDIPNEARIDELKSKLIELEKNDWYLTSGYTSVRNITNPTLYGNLRAQRLELRANREKLEDKIKSENDPAQLKSLNDQRAEIMAQQKKLIARMGDPLISVQAPDAVSVVALMPDGQIKQLVFDAQKNRWEARFDIPASAAEGEYTIQIIVVRKDGSRQMLQMHYSVDLTPPAGNAQMKVIDKNYSGQKVLRLKVQTDDNAARVSALLPWNAKVELMPSENTSNQFFALTPVPESYDKSTFPVTFVLTDKAHNRAEITVEQMP